MSDESERSGDGPSASAVIDYLDDWYHVVVLGALMTYMLWVRLRAVDNYTVDGRVLFSGNDAWYHLRQVTYTVNNFPQTMPFDPWTNFPLGTSSGQFGTLFDQLIALGAIVAGLGSPSEHTAAMALLVAPAVFGTAVAIPTYFITRQFSGRLGALFAAAVLALLPGVFLGRGLVGQADHNIAEPLFMSLGVLGMLVAVGAADRHKPVWEQVVDRDVDGLREVVGWSVLAGVATGLYVWAWPPGAFLIGIFAVYFGLQLTFDYWRGVSPDHVAMVGAVSMATTAVVTLMPVGWANFEPVRPSLLQPMLALLTAFGAAFLAWLARQWDDRDLSRDLYPVSVAGIAVVGAVVLRFASPRVFNLLYRNVVRIVGFGTHAQTQTIGEARPWLFDSTFFPAVFQQYGMTFFVAAAAALLLAAVWYTGDRDPRKLLLLVWTLILTAAAFTQIRFNYYLVVPVAVLNGYFLGVVVDWLGLGSPTEGDTTVQGYQVLAVVTILLIVAAPLTVGMTVGGGTVTPAHEYGSPDNNGPFRYQRWDPALTWMQDNTPAEGDYADAGNADQLDYYGTYGRTDDYDYPEGAYGVMSWWDYGHWITAGAERIPVANPFQQHADDAANFLLAPSESAANDVVENLGDDDEETRYVMVDWQMVSGFSKLHAPATFYDRNGTTDFGSSDLFTSVISPRGRFSRPVYTQRYYESMMVRLYRFHGSAVEPAPVVVDWQEQSIQGQTYRFAPTGNTSMVQVFDSMKEARAYVRNDSTSQIGGVGANPQARVPALEHYRLVRASENPAPRQLLYSNAALLQGQTQPSTIQAFFMELSNSPSYVKTFERVPGATIEGEGPANTTVNARVQMQVPTLNTTFTYTQQARTGPDGEFTMTLPYSTTGYDETGDGYTNVSTRATGPYRISTRPTLGNGTIYAYSDTVNVSDSKVVGADDSPVDVTLEKTVLMGGDSGDDGNDDDSGNTSAIAAPTTFESATVDARG